MQSIQRALVSNPNLSVIKYVGYCLLGDGFWMLYILLVNKEFVYCQHASVPFNSTYVVYLELKLIWWCRRCEIL